MNNINYIGDFRPRAGSRAFDQAFWTSDVVFGGTRHQVVDAAGMREDGQDIVRLIPYGANSQSVDELVKDGDLLAYVRGRNVVNVRPDNADNLLPVLKGRASHAELCYCNLQGRACHVSLWGAPNPICPTDCGRFCDRADNAALGIYRVSLKEYGIDAAREKKLKTEVKKWKEIVRPVNFPNGVALNFDPVDFASIEALGGIAGRFLRHVPSDSNPPVNFKLNCVQWSTLVLSLAICYPLTRQTVAKLGVVREFEANWNSRVGGYCEDGVEGLGELPIPFYTPLEVVENALDLYLPKKKNVILDMVNKYPVENILHSKGLSPDHRVIMPSAFIIENRLRNLGFSRKTKTIFEYVATALPEHELIREG